MLYLHIFLVSLLCISNLLLCLEPTHTNNNQKDPITITPSNIPEKPEKIHEILDKLQQREHFKSNKQTMFTDAEIEEMELAFEQSPKEAQCIANHLQDPTFFPGNEDYRAAYFVGKPGSGKTTTAQAIAYKMSQKGWKYKIFSSTSFLGEYRNQTAIKLQKELETIAISNEPTIVIIDELHRLLENAESKHHDTDTTATTLWMFLDKQKGNKNFFLIGTMNRVHKLPKPYKSRILFDCIDFTAMTDSNIKNKTFRSILTHKNAQLDEEVTDVFLNQQLERIGECFARDLQKITRALCRKNRMNNPNATSILLVTKTSISQTINDYINLKTKMNYDLEDEIDEERHHQENMNLQKKHHEEQMQLQKKYQEEQTRLQKENQGMQHQQFMLQQRMQILLTEYQHVLARPSLFVDRTTEVQQAIRSTLAESNAIYRKK